jgi:hypothetical protein
VSRSAGRAVAARLVGAAAAAALLVGLVPTAVTAASEPTVERRKIGASVILAASEPRPHVKPTKRATTTVSDFDGDRVDDLAVAGDSNVSIGTDETGGAVAVRYSSVQRDDVFFGVNELVLSAGCADLGLEALATGDFNNDRYDDLVASETCEAVTGTSGRIRSGAVWVLPGSSTGLHISTARLISRATTGVAGSPTGDEWFGSELAAGDLDSDGYDDLAIGSPYTSVSGAGSYAGSVVVLYGSRSGLSGSGSRMLTQSTAGIPGAATGSSGFGSGLAIATITPDSYPDLVVGIPGAFRSEGSGEAAGAIVLVPGGRYGVTPSSASMVSGRDLDSHFHRAGHQTWISSIGGTVTTADLDGDGRDEVVTASPYGSPDSTVWGGFVVSLAANGPSLSTASARLLSLDSPGMPGTPTGSDVFGSALAATDLDKDGRDDLAIGARGRKVAGKGYAGAVYVVLGSSSGLSARGAVVFTQDSAGVPGTAGSGNTFGASLAFLDLDGSGRRDLVVGAPEDELNGDRAGDGSGSVTVFRNVWGKLTPDERWGGRVAGITGLTDRLREFGTQIA